MKDELKYPSNKFLAYVRVSSKDQSRGTSLEEQKSYIQHYAKSRGFITSKFYGEVESASKTGRQIFDEMIKELKNKNLRGIIFHKVDRSARNPKDQALLYDLMLQGYELHFVAEGLNTSEPMGRNMMYMMWGMASAYSENLKSEINKGINGRLKKGKWPLPAPVGYLKAEDCKSIIDPIKGPLVKKLFEEYGTGKYSVQNLLEYSKKIEVTNTFGRFLDKNGLHTILRNTFYYGLLSHKRGKFEGEHEPLISKALFDKVQFLLKEKGFKVECRYHYIFRGLLRCSNCKRKLKSMTAKKRYKYYFCRDWHCGVKTIPEPLLEEQFINYLKELEFNDDEVEMFKKAILSFKKTLKKSNEEQIADIDLQLKNITARLDVLLQKFIDQRVDDETYNKTRESLLNRQLELKERRDALDGANDKTFDYMREIGKLLKNPIQAYKLADSINKRRLIISMVENFELNSKNLTVNWKKPFDMVAKRPKFEKCGDGES